MFNEIVNGISIKLNSEFGDSYEIYDEDVEQGLEEPCFSIKPLPVTNKPLLGKRKQRTYSFVVTYFPEKGNEEMMRVSERMMDALEYITLLNGEMVRALSLESEIVDGVLHFSVKYSVFLNVVDELTDGMASLQSEIVVRGE